MQSLLLVNVKWKPLWSFILLLFKNSPANLNFFKKSLKHAKEHHDKDIPVLQLRISIEFPFVLLQT